MTAVLQRYNEHQFRIPSGENGGQWAKQPGMSFDDYGKLYDVYDESATESGLTVVSMTSGELQLAFDDPTHPDRRHALLDLDEDDMRQVRDAAREAVASDVQDDWELTEDGDVWLRVSRLEDGVALEVPAEEWSVEIDLDEADDLVAAVDDQLERVDELDRSGGITLTPADRVLERKYNPGQPRDPGGEGGGQWVSAGGGAAGGLKDVLKLAGKIDLEPNEKLLGSGKIDGDVGGIRMALTERNGNRMLRFGAGGEMYGQRDRETGTPAWDGNPSREPLPDAERRRLAAESDALDDEYDSASPVRQDEITARQDEIRELLAAGDEGFNGTARLDEFAIRRLADRIRPALAEAVEQDKAENKAWDEIEALEAKGNPEPARLAALRQITDRTDYIVFDQGIVPGSAWGDVHWSVELDDPTSGPYLKLGVQPKDAPDNWADGRDWQGTFDAAETRKLLQLLGKMGPAVQRARSPEQGATAPASQAPQGGQFALGGGRVGAKGKKRTQRRPPTQGPAKPKAPAGPLSFDGKTGTGYGVKGGDPRVRQLQAALNRLGLSDSSGAGLAVDGKYGPRTTSSVKKLQKALGVPVDGKVTPELLKQATELKQLPEKPRRRRRRTTGNAAAGPMSRREQPARRAAILAQVSRALGEHRMVDGVCTTCPPSID